MPDYDAGFKIVAHLAGQRLAELAGIYSEVWEPIGGEVQATERLADRAFRAASGKDRFVVYMEAYTRWQAAAPWSILAKSGLLSERERVPTVSLLYVLLPRGYKSHEGTFRLALPGGPTQQVWFREICLWQHEPQPWWEQAPALMALSPLCRHPRRSRRQVLTHAAGIITEQVADRSIRADLLTTLGIFGKLVFPDVDAIRLIGREQMKESKLYQEILLEGRQEGRQEAQRADILEALALRFGPAVPAETGSLLQNITDTERLIALFRVAIRCPRLADFRRALDS